MFLQGSAYFWQRKQVVCVWDGGWKKLINSSIHVVLYHCSIFMFTAIRLTASCPQIMRDNQFHPTAWDIIWKWKFDSWTLFIRVYLRWIQSASWLGLMMRIWSVTILWAVSLTKFTFAIWFLWILPLKNNASQVCVYNSALINHLCVTSFPTLCIVCMQSLVAKISITKESILGNEAYFFSFSVPHTLEYQTFLAS